MEKFTQLKNLVSEMEADVEKFYDKQNAAAGTRVRKSLQDIKNLSQDLRLEVQNMKNDVKATAEPVPVKAAPKPAAKAAPKAAAKKK